MSFHAHWFPGLPITRELARSGQRPGEQGRWPGCGGRGQGGPDQRPCLEGCPPFRVQAPTRSPVPRPRRAMQMPAQRLAHGAPGPGRSRPRVLVHDLPGPLPPPCCSWILPRRPGCQSPGKVVTQFNSLTLCPSGHRKLNTSRTGLTSFQNPCPSFAFSILLKYRQQSESATRAMSPGRS